MKRTNHVSNVLFEVQHCTNNDDFLNLSQFQPATGEQRVKDLFQSLRKSIYTIKGYSGFDDIVALSDIEELEILLAKEYLHKSKIENIINTLNP